MYYRIYTKAKGDPDQVPIDTLAIYKGRRKFVLADVKPKDDTGPNGIACMRSGETIKCYPSTPTTVTLQRLSASSSPTGKALVATVGVALLAVLAMRL